jgi:subtilisin family serine protease
VPDAASAVIPGELLVDFKSGVGPAEIDRFYADHGLSERQALDHYTTSNASHLKLVAVPAAHTTDTIAALESDPRVAYAEPNYVYSNVAAALTPTEAFYAAEWHLQNTGQWSSTPGADIGAPAAWQITTGSPDVLVAELDTGVDYTHPDLTANIWTNPNEIPGDGIDNDGDGYADDVHGIDAINRTGNPMDDGALGDHGTSVAGIIGATPFNGGTVGVDWRVGIIPIKVVSDADTVKTSDLVAAFEYVNYLKAVEHQNIVATNNSYVIDPKSAGQSRALRDAMAGLDQPGMAPILHVCAAGNANADDDANPVFPACYNLDNIVTVAATDFNDNYAGFSSYGATSVDLAAPGQTPIITTGPNGGYTVNFAGTSAAAPQVTAAAALVASAFPGITADQIKQRLLDSVDPIGQIGNNALKPTVTNGRLNVARALAGAAPDTDTQPPAAVTDLTGTATDFQSVSLNWTATGDDGSVGRASFYDLRYATAPITDATWDTATRAQGEPGPQPAGAAESFTVAGLDPSTTYYFGLKVRDEMGNESPLSDVAPATTAPAVTLFGDQMESGVNGWTASGLWHQSTLRSYSPSTSWYYGDEATRTYDTGAANSGTLTSPVIDLKRATHPVLIFREWREIEDVGATFGDSAVVQVGTGPKKWDTVSTSQFSTAIDPTNWQYRAAALGWNVPVQSPLGTPQWVSRAVDLSAYVGKTVQLRFLFATGDAAFNDFEGWYIDNVNVFDAAVPSVPSVSSGGTSGAGPSAAPSGPQTAAGAVLAAPVSAPSLGVTGFAPPGGAAQSAASPGNPGGRDRTPESTSGPGPVPSGGSAGTVSLLGDDGSTAGFLVPPAGVDDDQGFDWEASGSLLPGHRKP